jgi:hypothetical protein
MEALADGDSGDSGGGGDGGGDGGLGEGGVSALTKLRTENKDLQAKIKDMDALKQQLQQLENMVDPKVYADAKTRAETAEQRVREQDAALRLREKELEEEFGSKLSAATAKADTAEAALNNLRRRSMAEKSWVLAGGAMDANAAGETPFDAFWNSKGRFMDLDSETGSLFVLADDLKTPRLGEDGKRMDTRAWIEGFKEDPVYTYMFNASRGAGSGAHGARSRMTGSKEDPHGMTKGQLFDSFADDLD